MPELRNLPEDTLYRLLPKAVRQLDVLKLIQAVIGGIQDRVADLRSYVSGYPGLIDVYAQDYGQVLCSYTGPAGQPVPVTLDAGALTPPDGPDLIAWSAAQLEIDLSLMLTAARGTDPLREPGVDPVPLIAATIGATLYPGPPGETAEEQAARYYRIIQTQFQRLKVKGTPTSFASLAKLCGYIDAAMVPMWSRLSPRTSDAGQFSTDLASAPDYWPVVPSPGEFYDPNDFSSGPYYRWSSGTTVISESQGTNFILGVVNGNNPFVTLTQTNTGSISPLPPGDYYLTGGAAGVRASVAIARGTDNSGLVASAIAAGAAFDGTRLTVVVPGTTPVLDVLGRLSAIQYRSSYVSYQAWRLATGAGTIPVQPNFYLESGGTVQEGESDAPWLPWGGGSAVPSQVTLWPSRSVTAAGTSVPRSQVGGTTAQLDSDTERAAAASMFGFLDDVAPVSTTASQTTTGWLWQGTLRVAPYLSQVVLSNGTGASAGVVSGSLIPQGPAGALFRLDQYPLDTEYESDGGLSFFGGAVSGSIWMPALNWSLTSQSTGSVSAYFFPLDDEINQAEPTLTQKLSGEAQYASRPTGVQAGTESGTLQPWDDNPWESLRILAGGDVVGSDYFIPFGGDPKPGLIAPRELRIFDQNRVMRKALVMAFRGSAFPPPMMFPEADALVRRDAVAVNSTGTAVPICLVGDFPMATSMWAQPRTDGLAAFLPLTDGPDAPLTAADALGGDVQGWGVEPQDRRWSSGVGWTLSLSHGSVCEDVSGEAIGLHISALGGTIAQGRSDFAAIGPLTLHASGSVVWASLVGGTSTPALPFPSGWGYIEADSNLSSVGITVVSAGVQSRAEASGPGVIGYPGLRLSASNVALAAQDMCVWGRPRTFTEIAWLAQPPIAVVSGTVPIPYAVGPWGDRYALEVEPSGYVFVGEGSPDGGSADRQATVARYESSGSYVGDPEFKRVGFRQLWEIPETFTLGTRGLFIPATGAVVTGGTWPASPGFTPAFVVGNGTQVATVSPPYTTTGGSVTYSDPVGPLWPEAIPQANGVVDRIYLMGDTGQVYQCEIDDVGFGPFFSTSVPLALRSTPVDGEIGREQPTDCVTEYRSGTYALAVDSHGNVYAEPAPDVGVGQQFVIGVTQTGTGTGGALGDEAGAAIGVDQFTFASAQPIYMYGNSRVVAGASNALAAWMNPNAYGTALGVPALSADGELDFAVTGTVPAGWMRLVLGAQNFGNVGLGFPGFEVEVSIEGTGVGPILTQGTLLAGATDVNPSGIATLDIYLPAPLSGTWVLRIVWTNAFSDPTKGWQYSLGINSVAVRQLATFLYEISIDPTETNPLSISQIPTVAPNLNDPAPGAWVTQMNNLGEWAQWTHESQVYSKVNGPAPYLGPSCPAADALTATTAWDDGVSLGPLSAYQDEPIQSGPLVLGLSVLPHGPYNVGDPIVVSGTVTGTGLRYVWTMPPGTTVTDGPVWDTIILASGAVPITMKVVDSLGSVAVGSLAIDVNAPPLISYLQASPNNLPAPFVTTLFAKVSDPEGSPISLSWLTSSGSVVATGTEVNDFPVAFGTTLTAVAIDVAGGTSVASLNVFASPAQPPVVALADYPTNAKSNWPVDLSFAAMATDPDGKGLLPEWTFWDGSTSPGGAQPMPLLGNGTFLQAAIKGAVVPAGVQLFDVTVTSVDGLTATASAGILFAPNRVPTITSVTASDPGVAVGQPVYYAAAAIDPDGDILGYTWNFQAQGLDVGGANVRILTDGIPAGATLDGAVTVDDGFGGVVTQSAPVVGVFSARLGALTIGEPGGNYPQAISVEIGMPSTDAAFGAQVSYTLDGSDPWAIGQGNLYQVPFIIPFVSGQKVTLNARSFLAGTAPSPLATATYIFYTPPSVST